MQQVKHILSLFSISVFLLIAIASTHVNKLHCGAFNTFPTKKDLPDNRNFIVKNNGSIIYGEKIVWTSGVASNHQVTIDKQKFKVSEVRGYQLSGKYYGRYHSEYIQRITGGKLNVFYSESSSFETTTWQSGPATTKYKTRCYYYVQRGDNGEVTPIGSATDIKNFVSDCPKAFDMINKSSSQLRKAIRSNPNYLNDIFEVYNNDCK